MICYFSYSYFFFDFPYEESVLCSPETAEIGAYEELSYYLLSELSTTPAIYSWLDYLLLIVYRAFAAYILKAG